MEIWLKQKTRPTKNYERIGKTMKKSGPKYRKKTVKTEKKQPPGAEKLE